MKKKKMMLDDFIALIPKEVKQRIDQQIDKMMEQENPKMTEISKYSWVLVGVRPLTEEKLPQETLQRMLTEAFIPGKTYTLFLCGSEIDKVGTLAEMEEGLEVLKSGMEDYKDGDYCIISQHEEGSLLFLPMEMDNTDENISGDTDNLQG